VDLAIVHFVFVHGREFDMTQNVKIKIADIQKDVDKESKKKITQNISKLQRVLDERIEKIVFQRLITGLPTIQGTDLVEIGVPDINTRLTSIVQTIARNTRVKISGTKRISVTVIILEQDYSSVLSLPEAIYSYTSANGSGVLEWLRWILLGGGGQIIAGFEFSPLASPFSRTGGGLMVAGNSWRVPPNLSGTATNNILTRSLQNIEQDIKIIVNRELQRIIK